MAENQNMSWSLAELYPSFESTEFINDFNFLDVKIDGLLKWCEENLNSYDGVSEKLEKYITLINELELLAGRLSSYASLSSAADSANMAARKYSGAIEKKETGLTGAEVKFSGWVSGIEHLDSIIAASELLTEHEFYLKELVEQNKYMLSEKEEIVISRMKLTSSSSWLKFKNLVTADHKVEMELDGKLEAVGINKIKNMYFSKDKDLREKAYYAELAGNVKIEESVAASLNGIKGEVLALCELKGYESPLHKTLVDARMDQKTLDTMLKVMRDNLGEFQKYYAKKATLLGREGKLPYYDIMAPVGDKDMNFTYEEAKEFIGKHFSSFSNEFGDMAVNAFDKRWIDAEARDGKRGGAFCSNLRAIKESRILCSYEGSFKNVCTLAHELGHAYHGMILSNEALMNTRYPMPLAETASIFAENIVRNAAMEIADKEEAMEILGAELVNCCSVIVDIYARYLFETELFKKRQEGDVPVSEIKELMLWAQKEAYGDGIDENTFDPYAWMHKPHYYYAERNFYNFPYAFGLLFAKGLYSIYLKEGKSFVQKYNEVLRLTGRANVYDVAKYAGIDLHNEEFWQGSMKMIKKDIDRFCNL